MTAIFAATFILFTALFSKIMTTNTKCPDVKCSCVGKAISCQNSGFTQIPTFSSEDPNVEFLLLNDNLITTIPEKAFYQLPNLLFISIENNPLQSVHPLAFKGINDKTMSFVNQLKLSSPNLQKNFKFNLTSIVSQLPNLRRLDVTRLNVMKLEPYFVHNTLTQIVLDDVGLTEIDPQAFQRATALTKLTITKNSWRKSNTTSTLHKWLAPLTSLEELDLSSNELSGELGNLPSLSKLHTLKLERNRLTTISAEAVQGVKNTLRVLVLGFNVELKNFNNMLGTLQILESLYLNSNREALTSLPSNLIKMSQLRHLNIDYTDLSSIGQNELPASLETLSMVSCTKLRHIDPLAFANTKNLRTLIIEEIDLNDIIDVNWKTLFNYTQNLNKLYLSPVEKAKKTFSSSIWESIRTMTQMTDLSLANNRLEYVPDFIFQNLLILESLNLAGNYLTNLTSATFYGLSTLKKLILSGNKLNEFDKCTFSMLPLSVEVSLEDNPLPCVCSMRWLRVFLNNSKQLGSLTCENRSDKLIWSQLSADQFCNLDESAKLSACQIKSPPTASPLSPPRFSLQVAALKLFLEKDNLPLVRIDINFTQEISKILRSWYITYGEAGKSERLMTESLSAQTTFVDISDGIRSGTKIIFCPVFILFSGESYTHQSYCRNVSLKNAIEWKIILIIGIIGASLILIFVVVIYLYVLRHRKLLELQKNLTTTTCNTTVEEEDPYAYAVPDLLVKTKFKPREISGFRTQPNSRAFVRAKSQDANLNATHNSGALSFRTLVHHQSTPQLLKSSLTNGHANGTFTTSMISLHQNSVRNQRLSTTSSGYPQQFDRRQSEFNASSVPHRNSIKKAAPPIHIQRRIKAQTLQVSRPNDMARSIGNLAVRALPPAPRLAKSVEVMLDQSGCDEDEESVYVPMVQASERKVDNYHSWNEGNDAVKVDSYGISSVMRYALQPRKESNSSFRHSKTNSNSLVLDNANQSKAYIPLSTVPGSPSNFDKRMSRFENIVTSSMDDSDMEIEHPADCYKNEHF